MRYIKGLFLQLIFFFIVYISIVYDWLFMVLIGSFLSGLWLVLYPLLIGIDNNTITIKDFSKYGKGFRSLLWFIK